MQIYDCLTKDHDEVQNLLTDLLALDDEDSDERNKIVQDIRDALIPHARAEESVFYNSIRALNTAKPDKKEVMHGYTEHVEAETILRMLQAQAKTGLGWRATAEKLREALSHHIEEEESEIFSIARRLFTEDEAEMMGEAFEKMKPEIREEGVMKTTLDMVANLMPPRMKGSIQEFVNEQANK